MPEGTLTPDELAAELGVTTGTLANWRSRGIGPEYLKLTPGRTGRIRYTRAAVDVWQSSRTRTGAAA